MHAGGGLIGVAISLVVAAHLGVPRDAERMRLVHRHRGVMIHTCLNATLTLARRRNGG